MSMVRKWFDYEAKKKQKHSFSWKAWERFFFSSFKLEFCYLFNFFKYPCKLLVNRQTSPLYITS